MYQQPLRPQQTWSGPQFAQPPKPTAVPTWPTAPVLSSVHPASTVAPVPHPASHQAFVPPVPPGVNPQQWQNGRWMYTAPGGGMNTAQPQAYPPPTQVGWNVPAGWGITPQYYHPPQTQKQPERSYWDTQLTNNGLGLENMHIKQPTAHPDPGGSKDKAPHTPWAWVPRELDDDDEFQASSAPQYRNPPQPRQPSPVGHSGSSAPNVRQTNGTGYPPQGHAYFSVPGDQQHHHPHPQSAIETGSRPNLPPATVFSAHIRQRSNPNPHQSTTSTYTQPSATLGSKSTAPVSSQPTHGTLSSQRSHSLVAPTPQRPGIPESFTAVQQLRPTFSPAIVRTPNHYRHDSQPMVPSPRVAAWDEASGHNSAGVSVSANRQIGGVAPMIPSPRVFPWNSHARANGGGSPSPAPRNPQSSSSHIYDTSSVRGRQQAVQRSYSIPEPPRPAGLVSRQNSMPVVPSDPPHHHHHPDANHRSSSAIPNLAQFAEEPGAVLSPLIGGVPSSSESSESSTVLASRSPPPLFIPPRYGRSPEPSPRHRGPRSPSSSPSDSSDSDNRPRRIYRSPSGSRSQRSTFSRHSGHSGNSGNSARSSGSGHYVGPGGGGAYAVAMPPHTPQGRSPASSTHTQRSSASSNPLPTPPQERRDPGFSLPPPQQRKPPPGTYYRTLRYGFWNRRGDHLTNDMYVVYAPPDRANPRDLEKYPLPTEGYLDHHGTFMRYDATRRELPESLPREGRPPKFPYELFVTYVYL